MQISDPLNVRPDGERLIAFEVNVNEERLVHVQITCEAVLGKTPEAIVKAGVGSEMAKAIEMVKRNDNRRFTELLYEKVADPGHGDAGLPIYLNSSDIQ